MGGLSGIIVVLLAFGFVRKITKAAKNNPAATKVLCKGVGFLGSRWLR